MANSIAGQFIGAVVGVLVITASLDASPQIVRPNRAENGKISGITILAKVRNAYTSMKSYRDSGAIKTTLVDKNLHEESSTKIFDTAFVRNRGLGFRFQFRPKSQDRKPKPKDQFAYMWNPKGVKIFQADKVPPAPYSTLDDAMTTIIIATDGTGYNIPRLLLGGVVTGTDMTSLTNVSNVGVAIVNGILCFVVSGRSKSSEFVTLWIDTQKFVIRKSMVRALLANYLSETTITFRSDFDVPVTNEELIIRSPL